MSHRLSRFRRYGPWAIILGGSDGLGAEFARQLAAEGFRLVIVARRSDVTELLAEELRNASRVEVRTLSADLADSATVQSVLRATEGLDVGLLVSNAALSPISPFLELDLATHERLIDLNCRAPALFAHEFARRLVARGGGGLLFMSSMAGFQGTALCAHYAASKAYLRVLAEGLWVELRPYGVDVLACCAGLTETPTFRHGGPKRPAWLGVPVMKARPTVSQALGALGRTPVVVPGRANRIAAWASQRLLSTRAAIRLSSAGTRAMYPAVAGRRLHGSSIPR